MTKIRPNPLSIDRLREALNYDPGTGIFTWLINPGGRNLLGKEAGCLPPSGRRWLSIDQVHLIASRAAWAWMTGEWPSAEIDHEDTNPQNNRWNNLRLATRSQQQANQKTRCDNSLGLKGVRLHKQSGLFHARIGREGKSLGYFKTPEEAHAAYAVAAKARFGEFARP